ncbi:MAG: chorismate synthase [Ruminococcaceae bacterium]|nr:chorismate synthase [Oscillospiraceae bacterium]
MKNTFGNNFAVTISGESHGGGICVIIDGVPSGIAIERSQIEDLLTLRRPAGKISTARQEGDSFTIMSGIFEGYTTGTPICISIPNSDTRSRDYEKTKDLPRPGHADYSGHIKYCGFEDYRGGGHFSGRITAGIVAAGAVAMAVLNKYGIYIGTHVAKCGGVLDRKLNERDLVGDICTLNTMSFPVLDNDSAIAMKDIIASAAKNLDSIGGITETAVVGVPAGVGEPFFDSLEGVISHGLFSVPGIKGVEFGSGFGFANMTGKDANDAFYMDGGVVKTYTNNNGGINGGISNGMPIVFRCAVKPTPSIMREQSTVNMRTKEDAKLTIEGRHDPAIIHRASIVITSVTAIAILDMLETRYGECLECLEGKCKK